jgi:[ribosomal protein S5]-alanine N-acetyltransferase
MKYLLEGESSVRLIFRKIDERDFENWMPFFNHPQAAQYLPISADKEPYAQCKAWFERIYQRYDNDLGGMNALIDKKTNKLIGQCGILLQEIDGIVEFEIGYSILPECWGMGYATEAAIRSKELAFQRDYTKSLISIIHIDNVRSQKVALNNGMTLDKSTIFKEMPVNIFRVHKNSRE